MFVIELKFDQTVQDDAKLNGQLIVHKREGDTWSTYGIWSTTIKTFLDNDVMNDDGRYHLRDRLNH